MKDNYLCDKSSLRRRSVCNTGTLVSVYIINIRSWKISKCWLLWRIYSTSHIHSLFSNNIYWCSENLFNLESQDGNLHPGSALSKWCDFREHVPQRGQQTISYPNGAPQMSCNWHFQKQENFTIKCWDWCLEYIMPSI